MRWPAERASWRSRRTLDPRLRSNSCKLCSSSCLCTAGLLMASKDCINEKRPCMDGLVPARPSATHSYAVLQDTHTLCCNPFVHCVARCLHAVCQDTCMLCCNMICMSCLHARCDSKPLYTNLSLVWSIKHCKRLTRRRINAMQRSHSCCSRF